MVLTNPWYVVAIKAEFMKFYKSLSVVPIGVKRCYISLTCEL